MSLDPATLFTIATGITGLLGVFLLVVWLQERTMRALAWWGAAYLMGASAVALWGTQNDMPWMPAEAPDLLLFTACGLIWSGARLFHGRAPLPGALFAGASVWLVATQWSPVAHSDQARVVLSSLVIAGYAFLTAFELRRERRKDMTASPLAAVGVPLLHGAVFLSPIILVLLRPADATTDAWFALFALETLLYVVGTAFIVVVMAKERIAQTHKTAAMTDLLTGIFNRRALLEAAEALIARQAKKHAQVSVLGFDLDHFKSINDRFGHATGDDALKLFAQTASATMRATDVIGRLGGEEFVAILPGSAADARVVAERVRLAFRLAAVEISGHKIGATVSVGVAAAPAPVEVASLLARADAALYRAKANGRNRVEIDEANSAIDWVSKPTVVRPEPVAAMQ